VEAMTPYFEHMLAEMKIRYPSFSNTWEETRAEFGASWQAEFEANIANLIEAGMLTPDEALDGYAEFCTDALRSQIFFERNRRYKASNYAAVAAEYYHNVEFMNRAYLPGMFLSHFVWPHHHRMLLWFGELMKGLDGKVEAFAEVGVGCGMYSKEVLRLFPASRGSGYDISEHSLAFTKRVAAAFGFGGRYDIHQQDVILKPPPAVDLLLNQEVLEHLEDPPAFLAALYNMTRPGGHAYIAAAVNAAHVDHIYLYRSVDEVRQQLVAAGYSIVAERAELAYGGKPIEVTPCHAGFLCQRPAA